MLTGKKILIGVTGSIAAYKSAMLIRLLVKEGADVKVIMSSAAKDFISPLTLATLSKNPVISELFEDNQWADHVKLGRWADIMIIAPLSCNTLSKMAAGACDNLLMAVYLSATCPVMVAPAMDEDMWKHPSTKENLNRIISYGNKVISVNSGELASGLFGEGRMAEPPEIFDHVEGLLFSSGELTGKKVLVTAGPTFESIDPVRFVGNYSSGKMGIEIARNLRSRGAEVHLVLGPVSQPFDLHGLNVTKVRTAEEMYTAATSVFPFMDIAVMSAAVADYTPKEKSGEKIKKSEEEWTLSFIRTRDILKSLGSMKKASQLLIGFALETQNEKEHALAKLSSKNADMIVLNSLNDAGAGFGHDTNKVTIFDKEGHTYNFDLKSKKEVAKDIVDLIIKKSNA
jgi:phosphopantothenoylcysteine decarboxylase/phosphopantothenate--cysteine ligase